MASGEFQIDLQETNLWCFLTTVFFRPKGIQPKKPIEFQIEIDYLMTKYVRIYHILFKLGEKEGAS